MKVTHSLSGKKSLVFPSGLQVTWHNLMTCVGLLALGCLLGVFSLTAGSVQVTATDVFQLVFGTPLAQDQSFAVWDVRLPRLLIGFMAGWCVALSGAMLQSIARNPLADPGLFGLSQGSVITIVLLLIFVPDVPRTMLPFAAVAGGVSVALLLIALVGTKQGSGLAILLMGIAIESLLSAITTILILYTPEDMSQAIAEWFAGSLFDASLTSLTQFLPWFMLSLIAILVTGRILKTYGLGEHMAMAIGEPVRYSQPAILLVSVFLSSASVTAVGPLVFLGVMAPHLAGFLSPATGRARLVISGLVGGLLVVAADALIREYAHGFTLPIGIAITVLGVPLFIISLRIRALRKIPKN